jgi:hypothetical protein
MLKDFAKTVQVEYVLGALLENIEIIILLMWMNLKKVIWKIKLEFLKIKLRF